MRSTGADRAGKKSLGSTTSHKYISQPRHDIDQKTRPEGFTPSGLLFSYGAPNGTRTRVPALKVYSPADNKENDSVENGHSTC